MFQEARLFSQFEVRTAGDPASVANEVRRAVSDVLKTVPVTRLMPLDQQVDEALVPERLMATLSAAFGGLGAALAGIGLYGLLAYAVARRVNEIGIRMALGAAPRDVAGLVLSDMFGMVAAGLALGAPLAIWGRELAARLIPGAAPTISGPVVFGSAAIVALALAASYVPARRATRVDPMEALRHD
jgi:ABC-type antimicrobial peptide transport system permease subunit